jgi:hypothetical protein
MFGCAALYFEKKATPFDSAQEIVLTDVKCNTKHQYSSDLWPLKVKRNCIVDKSLAVYVFNTNDSHYVCPCICNGAIRIKIPPFDSA